MLTIVSISDAAEFGRRLRAVRKEQRLSQEAVAMAAGVGRGVLQKLEEGRGTVTLDSLIRIARALSCDVELVARHNHQ